MELVTDSPKEEKIDPTVPAPTPAPKAPKEVELNVEKDPTVSPDDIEMLASVKNSIATLNVEIKTLLGFSSDYLVKKYKIRDQAQFDRLFGGLS